ncbi:SICA antigen, partial [Plasmodium coatneyi]
YLFLGKKRKRHRRAHQVSGPPSLEEQVLDRVTQQDGPHEYTLVKKRRQPRSVSTGTKSPKKQGVGRSVVRRTIIDIHLEILDECQREDLHSTKEEFFEILVQEFMGSKFIEEENVPKEQVSMVDVSKEQDQMWRDVGNRVDPLVDAISKADTKADSYCNDDRWNNNVVTFAEREVCKFIARGLHHIYSTQTGDGRTDDRAKNDQRFKRTMECVLLNDYVDKLKEKAKKKGNCDVERGINEAFKKRKLTGLSEKIAGGDREVHTLCEKIDGKNTTLSKAQKEACNYIVRGLKYIYGVRSGGSSMDRNTRIFKQTMYCVFLNAYADKLKEKNPTCITEDTIKEAFKKGNTKKEVWCLDKQNGNCAVCEREENYGTCKLDINKSLWKPEMCEIDKDDVKKKVDGLLNSDGKIKTTLNTITEDVGRVLRSLSTAMTNNNEKMDLYCNTIGGPDSAEKKACQYITRGLEHVYNSQETGTWRDKDAAKKKKNNQQFDRTMGCAFLNVYADRIKKTCNEAKEGIDHAFEKSEEIKKETSPCNKDNNCVTCKREENFGCTLHVKDDLLNMGASARCEGDRQNIQNKLGKMLDLTTNKDPQYFFLGKKRRRHRREEQLISPPSEEKLLDHVDDQADGPHAYTLVKERRQQRSTPQRGRKKRAHRRGSGGGVRRRTIIDIHLQVLDEYQKGDLHSTKEDFLQIIVHEFMGRNFVKGENVPKEQVPLINIPEEQVQCLDSGFREEDFVPDEGCSKFRFRV